MDKNELINNIREGKIDINNQELFFSTLIKGLILNLNECISIRNIGIPHYILHTGSDLMYLEVKGQDFSIEPQSISNENYIYSIVPRCIVNPNAIDLIPDQLTNPYILGQLQLDYEENLYQLSGEFRRMPLKISMELKYYTDSFRDMLELLQQIITNLSFIRTYKITYMGQAITCSYKIPDNFSQEHLTELDGKTQDGKHHTLPISIEVETNLPIFSQKTMMFSDDIIYNVKNNINS